MSSAAEIAEQIFNDHPKKPGSISLGITEEMELKEIFEMLLMIFTEGMKIKHGDEEDKVDLNSLTETDFQKFQEYFRSFGFDCCYKVYTPNQQLMMDFSARKYTNISITPKTKLNELRLPLKCGPCVFEISFDFYKNYDTCHKDN